MRSIIIKSFSFAFFIISWGIVKNVINCVDIAIKERENY